MKRRPIAKLHESLEQRLTMYALAASAAGVGLLVLSQPAAARIVYTKAYTELPVNALLPLDLNHDGIADFSFHFSTGSGGFRIFIMAERANQVAGYCRHLSVDCWASALLPDVRVGPNQRFGPYSFMVGGGCSYGSCVGYGPWSNVQHRYLGFQFFIEGKVHYGWARLDVPIDQGATPVLTGYAYETVPNKPLVTGKTKGPHEITLEPRTLGHLARGASTVRE